MVIIVKLVFNSSPLIFLARLGLIENVIEHFENYNLYLPTAVANEVAVKSDQASISIKRLIESQQLEVQNINLISLANSLNERLGKGESDAIVLAIELQTDYIILDDAAARKEAMRLGLNVKGTLAIIRLLQKQQKISIKDTDDFYKKLMKINFRIKRTIFNQIFKD